jgi:hypothetical protein
MGASAALAASLAASRTPSAATGQGRLGAHPFGQSPYTLQSQAKYSSMQAVLGSHSACTPTAAGTPQATAFGSQITFGLGPDTASAAGNLGSFAALLNTPRVSTGGAVVAPPSALDRAAAAAEDASIGSIDAFAAFAISEAGEARPGTTSPAAASPDTVSPTSLSPTVPGPGVVSIGTGAPAHGLASAPATPTAGHPGSRIVRRVVEDAAASAATSTPRRLRIFTHLSEEKQEDGNCSR